MLSIFRFNNRSFKNNYGIEGREIIDVEYPNILKGQQFNVHSISLIKAIEGLSDDIIFSLPDVIDDANVIKVEDTKNDKFFVLNLISNI